MNSNRFWGKKFKNEVILWKIVKISDQNVD